jgi:hypothetical protein
MSIPIASVIADFVSLNNERQRLFGSTARVVYNSKLISAGHDNEATNALIFFALQLFKNSLQILFPLMRHFVAFVITCR